MAARAALNKALRHERSSVAGFGLPALFFAFVRMGGESDEGCDLFSGQAAELRQVGDQRRGHDGTPRRAPRAEPWRGDQAPHRWRCGARSPPRWRQGFGSAPRRPWRDSPGRSARSPDRRGGLPPGGRRQAACAGRPAPSGARRRETSRADRRALRRRRDSGRSASHRLRSVLARRPRALRKARIVLGWSFT